MPRQLKNFYDAGVVGHIAAMLAAAWPRFDAERFRREATRELDRHELVGRARHIMEAMHRRLPADYEEAIAIVVASLAHAPSRPPHEPMWGFLYMPYVLLVAEHGADHFEPSMRAQYELTRRFTAEFSIRVFLERHPERTLERLRVWAADPDRDVRRLVSEGTRPRLPWAPRLRAFQQDPRPVLALLELLKDDPDLYVRRSVANNLNDIGKDNAQHLVEVCARWWADGSAERRWIVRHALRSAIKRGDRAAMAVIGYGGEPRVALESLRITPARVRLGQQAEVSLALASTGRRRQRCLVDFAIHYVKAGGGSRAKVFKLRTVELAAGERVTLRKRISFADLSTRRHYPGRHRVEVLVNGRSLGDRAFSVVG